MGTIFSSPNPEQQAAVAAAAAASLERQRQRQRDFKAALDRHRRLQEEEQERQRQEQERERELERERLLQQARAQAALRLRHLRPRSPFTPPYNDKCESYDGRDWEWHFDRLQANNSNNNNNDNDDYNNYYVGDNDDTRDVEGYTGSDGYYRIPQQQQNHHHRSRRNRQMNQDDNDYQWRGLKKTDKAYTPHNGKGRRKRCRKGKGDLYENDYHAGLSKSEILAMSSERKAAFEVQKLKREQ